MEYEEASEGQFALNFAPVELVDLPKVNEA
jgi:hypothetical protein